MVRKFKIQNDRLTSVKYPMGVTGNVNTYICQFDISCDIPELRWFCVFVQGKSAYIQEIVDNKCVIPAEVLTNVEPIYIGCYGTNGKDDIKRVSTNQIFFDVKQGAYTEGTQPIPPTPDLWETLINKNIPYIGENGNWYIYDIETKSYKDSGQSSKGEGGASITVDDKLSDTSTNPVQNKVVSEQFRFMSNSVSSALAGASGAFTIANEAKTIAMGSSIGYVFDTEEDMYAWLAIPDNVNQLKVGNSHFYIRAVDVPDYWWDGEKPQQLETQKVDLTEYPKKEEFKSVNGESVLGEGDIKIQSGIKGIARQTTTTSGWVQFEPDENGVINIPCAGKGRPGLIAVGTGFNVTSPHGYGAVTVASENSIKNRWSGNMIDANNIDLAVKYAMTDGVGATWNDAQRLSALLRLGCTVDEDGFVKWTAKG